MIRFFVTIWAAFLGAQFVLADTTSIKNTISIEAHSGGNKASNGTVINGSSTSSVFVHTQINGEVVEHIEETRKGEDQPLKIHTVHQDEGTRVETKVNVDAGSKSVSSLSTQSSGSLEAKAKEADVVASSTRHTVLLEATPTASSGPEDVPAHTQEQKGILATVYYSAVAAVSYFARLLFS